MFRFLNCYCFIALYNQVTENYISVSLFAKKKEKGYYFQECRGEIKLLSNAHDSLSQAAQSPSLGGKLIPKTDSCFLMSKDRAASWPQSSPLRSDVL